jgi:hypothetical protein
MQPMQPVTAAGVTPSVIVQQPQQFAVTTAQPQPQPQQPIGKVQQPMAQAMLVRMDCAWH